MNYLPHIHNGKIGKPPKKKRNKVKSERKKAKELWREWYKMTKFIREM